MKSKYKNKEIGLWSIVFKDLAKLSIVLLVVTVINMFYPFKFDMSVFYLIMAGFAIRNFIIKTEKEQLLEIFFNNNEQQVELVYKSFLLGTKRKILPYKKARLEIIPVKSWFNKRKQWLTLYFSENKKNVFDINEAKDGLNQEILNKICEEAKQTPMRVLIAV